MKELLLYFIVDLFTQITIRDIAAFLTTIISVATIIQFFINLFNDDSESDKAKIEKEFTTEIEFEAGEISKVKSTKKYYK